MRMHRTGLLVALASLAGLTSSRTARALGPVDLEVAAKAGLAEPINGAGLNPLGFGLGGRAGVVLFDHLYGGVALTYYFGGSEANVSAHTLMYGVEAGWGFKPIEIVTIRPQVGLGNANFGYDAGQPPLSPGATYPTVDAGSTNNLYVEPGVTALLSLGLVFVGLDAGVLFFPGHEGGNTSAFALDGQVGVKF